MLEREFCPICLRPAAPGEAVKPCEAARCPIASRAKFLAELNAIEDRAEPLRVAVRELAAAPFSPRNRISNR